MAEAVAMEVEAAPAVDERVAWANKMRLLLSPKGAVDKEGALEQGFFKPKKVVYVQEKVWGPAERDKLYEGLKTYGVGEWGKMKEHLLPKWDGLQLRVKSSRLFGSQSVARYTGRKFTKAEIDAEYAKNKAIGERTGCWKAGVLVEDDNGSVALALKELNQ